MSDAPLIGRTYPADLEKQRHALESDPLLERFRISRRQLSQDRYRPYYHFTSPEAALNDPNGLCFWQGRWHLFYQAYPPEDPRQHWGHAVSSDLIHWEDLPYAISPGPEDCCFSGSALAESDRVIAMYHGTGCGNMVAVSSDPLLLNWEKLTGDAVIKAYPDAPYNVFDPCIWKQGDFYYSLSGGTLPHPVSGARTRADFLFRSSDLIHWEYLHPFYDDNYGEIDDDGACPYFWPLGDRWLLLHFSHVNGGKWMLGDYDTEHQKFLPCSGGKFNSASWYPGGVHAPSAAPMPDGSVMAIWNINIGKETQGWDQIMSLPRRLTPDGKAHDRLAMEPCAAVETLRGEHVSVGETALPANQEVVLPVHGTAMELRAVFAPGESSVLELNVFRSADAREITRIRFYPRSGRTVRSRLGDLGWLGAHESAVSVETAESSLGTDVTVRAPETDWFFLPPDEPLELRVFLDRSVLEVFANGKTAQTLRVYPTLPDADGVSVCARGSDGKLLSLDAWQMDRIF